MNYYNDNDRFACAWLRKLIKNGVIPDGRVDSRSITDVEPGDVAGAAQCHFFAGIAGWPLALQLAGWPARQSVWSASLPCQPFSCAGKQKGLEDERNLWPAFYRLVCESRPGVILGEQVPDAIGHGWLDRVFDDLEALSYTCGAIVLPACGAGAPILRHRIFWCAIVAGMDSSSITRHREVFGCLPERPLQDTRLNGFTSDTSATRPLASPLECRRDGRACLPGHEQAGGAAACGTGKECDTGSMESTQRARLAFQQAFKTDAPNHIAEPGTDGCRLERPTRHGRDQRRAEPGGRCAAQRCGDGDALGCTDSAGFSLRVGNGRIQREAMGSFQGQAAECGGDARNFWSSYSLVWCRDPKHPDDPSRLIPRRTQPGIFPLAPGLPQNVVPIITQLQELGFDTARARRIIRDARRNRIGVLRGAGNSISPWVAAMFISVVMEYLGRHAS